MTLLQLVHTCYLQKSSQEPPSSEGLPIQQQSLISSVATVTSRTTQHQQSSGQQARIGRYRIIGSHITYYTYYNNYYDIHHTREHLSAFKACYIPAKFAHFVKIASTNSLTNQF